MFQLNPDQEHHARNIIANLSNRLYRKFVAGAEEHGGDLRDMGAIKLVDNGLDEIVDLGTYSETLKETLVTINRLNLQAEVELQEGEYIKCLSTIQKIGRLL